MSKHNFKNFDDKLKIRGKKEREGGSNGGWNGGREGGKEGERKGGRVGERGRQE